MEVMQQESSSTPRYMMVAYPQSESLTAGSDVYKWTFLVTGMISFLIGLAGVVLSVLYLKNLFDYQETLTTFDWLFFGTFVVVCIWKSLTELMALIFLCAGKTDSLKSTSLYFGITFIVGALADVFIIAMVLIVLVTGSSEFNNVVKNLLLAVVGFVGVYFVFYTVSMLVLLKYINELPVTYEKMEYAEPQRAFRMPMQYVVPGPQ